MRSYTHLCWMSARGHKLASVQNPRILHRLHPLSKTEVFERSGDLVARIGR